MSDELPVEDGEATAGDDDEVSEQTGDSSGLDSVSADDDTEDSGMSADEPAPLSVEDSETVESLESEETADPGAGADAPEPALAVLEDDIPELQRKAPAKVKGVVDLVFLIDATGSMQPCIDDLKKNIVMFMGLLEEGADANSQSVIGDWRARVCAYRDWAEDDEPWIENPFVKDKAGLEAQLETLVADGGGDEPESLLEGMYKAIMCGETERGETSDGLKWRHRHEAARCLIVFTDATYHPEMLVEEAKGGTWEDVARVVEANRVILSLFAPEFPCYDELSQIDRCEYEAISFDANDKHGAVKALRDFTSDETAFRETLEALAASVVKSAETPEL